MMNHWMLYAELAALNGAEYVAYKAAGNTKTKVWYSAWEAGACHSTEVLEEPYAKRTKMANMYLVKIRYSSIMSEVQINFFVQSLTLTYWTSFHQ